MLIRFQMNGSLVFFTVTDRKRFIMRLITSSLPRA